MPDATANVTESIVMGEEGCTTAPSNSTTDRPETGSSPASRFRDWKHLRNACSKHKNNKLHALALSKLAGYRESNAPNSRGTVLNQMHVERNGQHVKVEFDIVMVCAKQDIPLRGHRRTEDALNRGFFLEMFKLISKYDPEVEKRCQPLPRNATLMSPETQNELCAASLLLQKIKKELDESTHYTSR